MLQRLITLTLVLMAAAANADTIQLGSPIFGGTGCSSSTARASISPDGKEISILFDDFSSKAGGPGGESIDRKNCDIAIPVKVPQGYSVAVFAIDYRGFAAIPEGGRLRFSADYFFAGKSSRRYSKEFLGPLNDNYTFRNELRSDLDVWSACGASVILRTQSSMVTESNYRNEETLATVDSIDVQSGIVYNIQYRRCGDTPPSPPPQQPPPAPPVGNSAIHGWIDNIQDLGPQGAVLNGWACAKTINASIDVHVYLNAAAGRGQFIKGVRADRPSEPAVANQCQNQYSAHRFSIPFSREELLQYAGSAVWVHGISPVGLPNLAIGNSGNVRFPVFGSNIHGAITMVAGDGARGNMVHGYACHPESRQNLEIEVFVGGPAGVGTFVGSARANQYTGDENMRSPCRFGSYGFSVQILSTIALPNMGKPIFAYAIQPGTGNLIPLDGSGGYTIIFDNSWR